MQACPYGTAPRKIVLITYGMVSRVLAIKLIRTDTTLDLSQKAEKGMDFTALHSCIFKTLDTANYGRLRSTFSQNVYYRCGATELSAASKASILS